MFEDDPNVPKLQQVYSPLEEQFRPLFVALDVTCHFASYVKQDSVKWKGYIEILAPYAPVLHKVIQAIANGKLHDYMGNRTKPSAIDIKRLAAEIQKRDRIEANTQARINAPTPTKLNPKQIRDMLEAAKSDPRGKGGNYDFMETEKFRKDPKQAFDEEITRRCGSAPKDYKFSR